MDRKILFKYSTRFLNQLWKSFLHWQTNRRCTNHRRILFKCLIWFVIECNILFYSWGTDRRWTNCRKIFFEYIILCSLTSHLWFYCRQIRDWWTVSIGRKITFIYTILLLLQYHNSFILGKKMIHKLFSRSSYLNRLLPFYKRVQTEFVVEKQTINEWFI